MGRFFSAQYEIAQPLAAGPSHTTVTAGTGAAVPLLTGSLCSRPHSPSLHQPSTSRRRRLSRLGSALRIHQRRRHPDIR